MVLNQFDVVMKSISIYRQKSIFLEEIREKNANLSDVGQFMQIKLILVSGAVNSLRFADRICTVS